MIKMETATFVYDRNIEAYFWIDPSEMDTERHEEYEPEQMAQEILENNNLEEVILNPHEHVANTICFPQSWRNNYMGHSCMANPFYAQVFAHLAEKILDEYMDDDLCNELTALILRRARAMKGGI